ncbi:MAG: DUF2891 domain-containing protein [Proteobacteria bacterium]|nr:DUF2891 domain-containing protein [Pseudomonadota bacterium]
MLTEARELIARGLSGVIRDGILQEDPHAGLPGCGVFAGSYDWHSCVHAHWALLCMTRQFKDGALEEFLRARLTPDALAAEWGFLNEHESFEVPYGRAWLLLTMTEMMSHKPLRSARIATIRGQLWHDMHHWLDQAPFPEYGDNFSAKHDSWLFSYFLLVLASSDDLVEQGRCLGLYRRRIEPVQSALARYPACDNDFIDMPALLATTLALIGHSEPTYDDLADFAEVDIVHGHAHGRAVMRLWPCATMTALGVPKAIDRLDTQLADLISQPERWREDFRHVSHWVPQFIWMALWLSSGCQ